MITRGRSRRGHARPRRKIRDRLTPVRLRVWYGPDKGAGYLWSCNRCARRPSDGYGGGSTRTLAWARARAKAHARGRGHWWMRAVYEPPEG